MSDRAPSVSPWTRRRFVAGIGGLVGTGAVALGRQARAADSYEVSVPHLALGAIVSAIGGDEMVIEVDPSLPLATLKLGSTQLSLAERVLLKGEGDARRRYLDDARNAPKLGAAVRDGLSSTWPQLTEQVAQRHKTWSRGLAHAVLQWSKALADAGLRDKRVRDPGGRIYLLEWAGAIVTSDGASPPAALARAPQQPNAATDAAYRAYVQSLVDALS
ncbi:MAG: hypothetical protein AB1Z98_09660 [Nannocystaceae bacterium]